MFSLSHFLTWKLTFGSLRRDPGILPKYCQSLDYPLYEIQLEAILKRLEYRPGLSGNEVGQMERVGENV